MRDGLDFSRFGGRSVDDASSLVLVKSKALVRVSAQVVGRGAVLRKGERKGAEE